MAKKLELDVAVKTLAETLNWPDRAVPQLLRVLDALFDNWEQRGLDSEVYDSQETARVDPREPGPPPVVDPLDTCTTFDVPEAQPEKEFIEAFGSVVEGQEEPPVQTVEPDRGCDPGDAPLMVPVRDAGPGYLP